MSECYFPDEWLSIKLGEIVEYGKTQKCEFSDVTETTWILELEDIEKDSSKIVQRVDTRLRPFKSTKNIFQKGDVLYGKLRPYLNKVVIADDDGVCSTEIIPLNGCPNINNHFLFYWMKTEIFLSYVKKVSYGVNMPRLGTKDGLVAPFILAPLAEQKVIADKLDALLAKVESSKARLQRIPEILKSFRQSVLTAAVSGKLTEEWRGKFVNLQTVDSIKHNMKLNHLAAWLNEQEKSSIKNEKKFDKEQAIKKYPTITEDYKDEFNLTAIDKIPACWLATNLDNVSIVVTGKTPSTADEDNWNGNIPFISPTQILPNGRIIKPERFVTKLGAKKIQLIPESTVMIVCIGTIGKVGLLETESAFNQQINALIPTQSIQSKFLFYWAKTLNSWLNKTSSAVVNAAIINKSRLSLAPCPLPSIEEQAEIVRRVEELFAFADSIEQKAQAALARVQNLTQSILAKAFRGELTADWRAANPELISGENSAEALLARIKAERASLLGNKRGRKTTAKD